MNERKASRSSRTAQTKKKRSVVTVRNAIPLKELSRALPGKISPATLRRYCRCGVKSRALGGKSVKMEWIYLTNGIGSNAEAYFEFLERINGVKE